MMSESSRNILPDYENLASTFKSNDVTFLSADGDSCKTTKDKYNIQSMPTFIILKSGKVHDTVRGTKIQDLKTRLTEIIPKSSWQ